ncbi:MAG: AI-2E family transporter [Oscillospiraceae bacterium]|nr:AI-2E family transporter [Oscillospiraceae bacterium]
MKHPEKHKYIYAMLTGFGTISLSVLFFFVLYRLPDVSATFDTIANILMPFIYGGVIAYLVRPMCNWCSVTFSGWAKGKYPKWTEAAAILCSMLAALLVVYALIIMIAPQLYRSMASLWNSIPDKVNQLFAWASTTFGENEALMNYISMAYNQVYNTLDQWASETLVPQITNIVSGVGMSVWKVFLFLKNILIGLIVAVYLLASRKKFAKQGTLLIRSMLKPRVADLVLDEIAYIDRMFGGFIDGKIVDSAIIGVLCYIGCSVFKFPNALLVSAIVGITNVIPFFGPFLGAIPSILLILIESPIKALWFGLFVLGLQQLDGNVIGPKILGDHTGVSSFWVLFSILLFGGMWGLVGMIVAVPLFAVIYDLIKRMVRRGLAKNDCVDMLRDYNEQYHAEEEKKD